MKCNERSISRGFNQNLKDQDLPNQSIISISTIVTGEYERSIPQTPSNDGLAVRKADTSTHHFASEPRSKMFTPEEDDYLFSQIRIHGLDFKKISKNFRTRTHIQLKRRYEKIKNLHELFPLMNLVSNVPSDTTNEDANKEEIEIINQALYQNKSELTKTEKVLSLLGQKRKYNTNKISMSTVNESNCTSFDFLSTVPINHSESKPNSLMSSSASESAYEDLFMNSSDLFNFDCNQSVFKADFPSKLNETLDDLDLKEQCQELTKVSAKILKFVEHATSSELKSLYTSRRSEYFIKLNSFLNSSYFNIVKTNTSCSKTEEILNSKLISNELRMKSSSNLNKLDACYEMLISKYMELDVSLQNDIKSLISSNAIYNELSSKLSSILSAKFELLNKIISLLNMKITWIMDLKSYSHS